MRVSTGGVFGDRLWPGRRVSERALRPRGTRVRLECVLEWDAGAMAGDEYHHRGRSDPTDLEVRSGLGGSRFPRHEYRQVLRSGQPPRLDVAPFDEGEGDLGDVPLVV